MLDVLALVAATAKSLADQAAAHLAQTGVATGATDSDFCYQQHHFYFVLVPFW